MEFAYPGAPIAKSAFPSPLKSPPIETQVPNFSPAAAPVKSIAADVPIVVKSKEVEGKVEPLPNISTAAPALLPYPGAPTKISPRESPLTSLPISVEVPNADADHAADAVLNAIPWVEVSEDKNIEFHNRFP
jgi:hypothetical protein